MKTEHSTQSLCGKELSLHTVHWAAKTPLAVMSLVHGLGEHCGRYADMATHLNKHGISVLAIDLRGHGQSEGARGICQNYDDLTSDLASLLAQTKRLYPALPHFLFGHSMGGGLVLHYALNHEGAIRGYLVSAPLIRPQDPVSKPLTILIKTLRKILPRGAISFPILGRRVSSLPKQQVIYETDPLNHGRLGFGLAVDIVQAGQHIYAHANQWNKPLRLWHSRNDKLTDFEASEHFAKLAKNCTFTAFDKVEHEMHNDTTQDTVYALMTEFILQECAA